MSPDELTILGALAETLIPADDTPGAEAAWAKAFVARHVRAHPDEDVHFRALADHVDALARTHHGKGFERLPVPDREALLRARHPSLADAAELDLQERALRRAMRDIIAGFLSADELDIHADPYHRRRPRRDRRSATGLEHSAADFLPDVAHDRNLATWVGTGTYARVWLAAGYPYPPGVAPEDPEDVARTPDELVRLHGTGERRTAVDPGALLLPGPKGRA